jgi:LL-diaminopimelate aminotransferase
MLCAQRLNNFNAYLGPAMNQQIARMRVEGRDVINLGLGDPDVTPPRHLLDILTEAVQNPDYHHYPSAYSIKPFYEAIADWYKNRHGVELDPETEMIYCLGSSEGLFHLNTCLLDLGDIALIPDPGYPSYEAGVRIAGGKVEFVPLLKENGFLPDLDTIPKELAKKAKLIWVNFPNNPTAATAGPDFYQKLIAWAKEYNVVVISDNPYMDIYFEGFKPASFLEFLGAKEVGVELNSLSKSFNCCGWRVGMVVGNQKIVAAMAKIKSQSDRGMYYPMQLAAIAALNGPTDWMEARNKRFEERRDIVVSAFNEMGLEMMKPKATFYCWGAIAEGYNSRDFCFKALEEANVWMTPGSTYGKNGEGYVRIACTQSTEHIAEAMERLKKHVFNLGQKISS